MVDHQRSRAALRNQLRARRGALPAEFQDAAGRAVATRLAAQLVAARWRTVLAYRSHAGELGTEVVLRQLREAGVRTVGLPRVDGGGMTFHHVDNTTTMEDGPFGIPSPPATAPLVDPDQAEVILVPLVGFDDQGTRLGMGGGYYDRLLAAHPAALRVGLAHDLQRVSRLMVEPWDARLDVVLTPSMSVTFAARRPDSPLTGRCRP